MVSYKEAIEFICSNQRIIPDWGRWDVVFFSAACFDTIAYVYQVNSCAVEEAVVVRLKQIAAEKAAAEISRQARQLLRSA